jgi:hypothetical protein
MKGGKEGRKRRSAGGGAGRTSAGRGKPKKAGAKRPIGTAPKKGSRKKAFGATTTSDDE